MWRVRSGEPGSGLVEGSEQVDGQCQRDEGEDGGDALDYQPGQAGDEGNQQRAERW